MKSIKIILSLLVFTFALSAKAAPVLNGLAIEKQFNKDLYIAAIYSENLARDSATLLDSNIPRRLEVRVIAGSLPARRFRNQWMEAIAINNRGDTLSSQAENMVTFANLFKGRFLRGDQLGIDFAADTGLTTVALNGIHLGEIADPDFFNTLLRAWVGPVPPSTDFRDGLLSAGQVSGALVTTFESLVPSNERIAALQLKKINQEKALAAQEPPTETSSPKPTLDIADLPPPTLALAATAPGAAALGAAAMSGEIDTSIADEAPQEAAPGDSQSQTVDTSLLVATKAEEDIELITVPPEDGPLSAIDTEEMMEEDEEAPLTADMILARQIYHSSLLRHTFRYIRYPKRAQERGQQGSVRLNVTIDSEGQVQEIQPVQESRFSSLNREARAAVRRAGPYPGVPSQLGTDTYSFSIPITFNLPD
ncbi:TonB family protein [Microbulbifer sp. OS29]|uniref:TonB family protein n=1 Tax=Microbulbifer okhotskensis TaxID=2926617 RepID=A0A9X2EPB8_9GAMM|nr:TonB family protein [Microbulbifer okhotskensis]MCO1333243.1 TonB family protein [Microbulbifer okhotskensis]